MIGRTIQEVFPNSLLMSSAARGSDYLLVGFKDDDAEIDPAVVERNSEDASNSRSLAMALLRMGRRQEAQAYLNRGLSIDPSDEFLLNLKSRHAKKP